MTAYMMGAFVSEAITFKLTKIKFLRWETILCAIEILFVMALGFVPDSAPFQISQVAINFICSMQYNTFRQAEGIPMATTFCTNHTRQLGINLCHLIFFSGGKKRLRRLVSHLIMLMCFVLGGCLCVLTCGLMGGKAIWVAILPLSVLFFDFLSADLTSERNRLNSLPHGY